MHQTTLPKAPKTFKQIKSHIHSAQFMQACDKEVRTLFEKGIFKYAMETEVPDNANIPPLMWILSYKFD